MRADRGAREARIALGKMGLLVQAGPELLREVVPLEQVRLMDGLDAPQRARLAACLKARRLASGEYLFRLGDPGDWLYVITAGWINVYSGMAEASSCANGALPQRLGTGPDTG